MVLPTSNAHEVVAVDPSGERESIVEVPGQPSGLGWTPDGRLLVVSMLDRRLLRLDGDGLTEVADLSDLAPWHCNDMVVDADGGAYVGNFGSEYGPGRPADPTVLVRVEPDGTTSVAARDLRFPNGNVITPDAATLVIAESQGNRLTAFDRAPDGGLSGRRVWAALDGVFPDGITLDEEGAIWVADARGPEVLRVREGGEVTHRIATGEGRHSFACMLGGQDRRTALRLHRGAVGARDRAGPGGTDRVRRGRRAGNRIAVSVDILLIGATGVTGRVTARHLSQVAEGVTWAVAGRDPERLGALVEELDGPHLPRVVALDLGDADAVDRVVAEARVVLSAAGPYARLSPAVIDACARHGRDYVDLSGEMGFVAEMVARHHDAARSCGARIVQVCGFEALPFDLGVRLLAERALAETGQPLSWVEAVVDVDPGGPVGPTDLVSDGTFSSLREELASDRASRLTDPALLLPPEADADRVRRATPSPLPPFLSANGGPAAPMTPSPFLNPPVILRTAALLGPAAGYDADLAYREGTAIGGPAFALPLRLAAATALSAAQVGVALLAQAPAPVRRVVTSALAPFGPSGGPDPARAERWSWRLELRGRTSGAQSVAATVEGRGHPGYGSTARALAEVGLLLADPEAGLPDEAGHLPPAVALGVGDVVRERLARGGVTLA